jgi:hypothetical protein
LSRQLDDRPADPVRLPYRLHYQGKQRLGNQHRMLHRYAPPISLAGQQTKVFGQQAMALGGLFAIAANFTDPDAYFVGGGVVGSAPRFRAWFLAQVRDQTVLRTEQATAAAFALVPDLDMAGARGSVLAAVQASAPLRRWCHMRSHVALPR